MNTCYLRQRGSYITDGPELQDACEVILVPTNNGPLFVLRGRAQVQQLFQFLSTGSGRHSDAAHEIHLIGCCILLNVVPKNVPLSGSSWSPLDHLLPFGRLASLEAMRLFKPQLCCHWMLGWAFLVSSYVSGWTLFDGKNMRCLPQKLVASLTRLGGLWPQVNTVNCQNMVHAVHGVTLFFQLYFFLFGPYFLAEQLQTKESRVKNSVYLE